MTAVPPPRPVEERVAALLDARRRYAEEVLAEQRAGFPTYEVPAFVAERFPSFDPADPSTWPEPDRCTEGRPWGHDAYGTTESAPDRVAYAWQQYLRTRDARSRPGVCRNRWRDEGARLCGTHVKPYRDRLVDAERRLARYAREGEHLDLARRLAAHGIAADSSSAGVLLDAEQARRLLDLLAATAGEPAPTHDRPR